VQQDAAYNVANNLLRLNSSIDDEAIRQVLETVRAMPPFAGVDFDLLKESLEANNNVHVGGYAILDDLEYKAWLKAKKEENEFRFWNRYERFLREAVKLPDPVIRRLDDLTDEVLDRLRDPQTAGAWDRRGLVVGDVQSGKTSNYTGLICKAVDAGYRLIIVLAGVHNSLRSQTQIRLDEGVLGFDTRFHLSFERTNQRTGVGLLTGAPLLVAHSLTSSTDTGDFRRTTVQATQIIPGGNDPVLLVVKKHVSVLKNLLNWTLSVRGDEDPSSPLGKKIYGVPLLLIDDEADYASANTNEYLDQDGQVIPDNDPTKTNKLIRRILASFEQSAYVGYTATPFANIFTHHKDYADTAGEGLFPRSFIVNIPAPSNYLGAEKLFGLKGTPGEVEEGLPVIRRIRDTHTVFPPKHKKDHPVNQFPPSLLEAIKCFILVCAARRCRGDVNVHNSMLVHVTRFTAVQGAVASLIKEEFDDIRRQIEYPGTGGSVKDELRALWENDFIPTTRKVDEQLTDEELRPLSWSAIAKELVAAVKRIEVREINGSAKDALDYVDHPKGLSVIAVGGDKLSRGLTLEGLSVSYFVRTSRMYDTLMQMGRWFGYRPRYTDLIRLYTSPELIEWYRHIATATSELREEFDMMFARGLTPIDFGNRVLTHPDGLLITAANKMRAGRKIRAGFSGTVSETVVFDLAPEKVEQNFHAFDQFVSRLGRTDERRRGSSICWSGIAAEQIIDLMKAVTTSSVSWKANSGAIAKYIENRSRAGRLVNWTVLLASAGTSSNPSVMIGGQEIKPVTRSRKDGGEGRYSIGRLVDPPHEMTDLSKDQIKAAMAQTRAEWIKKRAEGKEPKNPAGWALRSVRAATDALLIIYPVHMEEASLPLMGFAISFPADGDAPLIEYAENSVRRLEEIFE
jgi:Z1 domain